MIQKIIKKKEKISFVCNEAYRQFVDVGIGNFSLNQFISSLNMSKGQFYYYFPTKDQLIFQVMSQKSSEIMESSLATYKDTKTFMDKINLLFAIYLNQEKYYTDFKKLIIDSLHIYINTNDIEIKKFNNYTYNTFFTIIEDLLDEEIKKGYFIQSARKFAKAICATADGMFMHSLMIEDYDLAEELSNYFIEIEKLLQVKKGELLI